MYFTKYMLVICNNHILYILTIPNSTKFNRKFNQKYNAPVCL